MNKNKLAQYTKYNPRYTFAFTLIELLVVISIIGILATLITVSFTSSQRQARDTRRKSDLAQYRASLENYANRNNLFPASAGAMSATSLCGASYLNTTGCPADPNDPTTTYKYCTDGTTSGGAATATQYALWANLENVPNTYWTVCSNGKSGASTTAPACGATFNCNLP